MPRSAAASPAARRPGRLAAAVLLAVGLAAGCGDASAPATPAVTPGTAGAPRQVNVILKDYIFVPGIVDLVPGETITLNVVNGGLDVHELVLGPQAVQDAWEAAEEVAANPPPGPTPAVSVPPAVAGLRVVVGSGETRTVTYDVPADTAEQLLLGCHISDHWEKGMAGAVRFVGPGGVPLEPAPSGSPWAGRRPPAGPGPAGRPPPVQGPAPPAVTAPRAVASGTLGIASVRARGPRIGAAPGS